MNKFLFLDIDGVLNNKEILTRHHDLNTKDVFSSDENLSNLSFEIGTEQVDRINSIVARTGCRVVVSSSWRALCSMNTLNALLITRKSKFELYDYTYSIYFNDKNKEASKDISDVSYHNRGFEIAFWLAKTENLKSSIVIIDDDNDMEFLEKHLVKTTFEKGILDEDVDKACEILEHEIDEDTKNKIREFYYEIQLNKRFFVIENLKLDGEIIYG